MEAHWSTVRAAHRHDHGKVPWCPKNEANRMSYKKKIAEPVLNEDGSCPECIKRKEEMEERILSPVRRMQQDISCEWHRRESYD